MRICYVGKDGGKDSTVWGFWPIEIKRLFSVALLCFEDGSRDAYHSHAFNAISWVLKGRLIEYCHPVNGKWVGPFSHYPSFKPIFTPRNRFHQVVSSGRTWVLTLRGPWSRTWREYLPNDKTTRTLTHGRQIIDTRPDSDT